MSDDFGFSEIGPGHNRPPPELSRPESLRDNLGDAHADLRARAAALLAAEPRLPSIENDEKAGKVSDYIKEIGAECDAADTARTILKAPYLEAGRVIDGFFKGIIDPLDALKERAKQKLTTYLEGKAEKARASGAVAPSESDADLSRTRGDFGSVSSLKATWDFEVESLTAVPRTYLMLNDAAIKAHIKARTKNKPPEPIAGIRFFLKKGANVR